MNDVSTEPIQLVLHNDDETPLEFVVELLHSVFKTPIAESLGIAEEVNAHGRAICGIYPRGVANELIEAAQQRIRASGHPLLITNEAVAGRSILCKLCGEFFSDNRLSLQGVAALICDDCMHEITSYLPEVTRKKQFNRVCEALSWHFAGIPRDQLVATSRQFPGHMRADVQVAVDGMFSASPLRFFGIDEQQRYETLTFAALTRDGRGPT